MRKRVLSIILCLCMMFMLLPVAASAETVTGEGFSFDTSTGVLTITSNEGTTSWGTKVASRDITSAVIQNTVTSIENLNFYYCSGLTSVTIPNSVTSIGVNTFGGCEKLTSITIPDSVTSIGNGAFSFCTSLTSVTIPASVTSIGGYVFVGCDALNEIKVSDGNSTYSSKDGVLFNKAQTELICYPGGKSGSYTIPSTVTSIGENTFSECEKLTSITIPDSVTSIGNYAFSYCTGLTSVTIPDSVTSIGEGAFYNCESLTSVTIPGSVTSIGESAFYNCIGLTSVTIPNSVTSIGKYTFGGCGKLTSITIPDSVTSIGVVAFDYCTGLTSITIPGSVTSIGDRAFSFCSGLKKVTFEGTGALTIDTLTFDGVPSDCKYYKTSESKSITGAGAPSPIELLSGSAETHKITVATASNGEISANVSTAAKGATVTVTAKPKDGYALKSLTVKTVSGSSVTVSSSNTFTMPEEDVTVTAEFTTKTLQYETDYVAEKKRLLELINAERAKQGVAPLTMNNTLLQAAADIREAEVAELFSHTRPNGTDCFTAIEEQGLTGYTMGENIAMNYSGVDAAVTQWMNSDGHRANILNASFTQTAFGVAKSGGEWYFVQMFFTGDNPKPGEIVEKGEASEKFSDVKSGDWYYDSVKYVQEKGLMVGTSDTTFEPNTTTNRGMIVTILYRLEGEPSVAGLSNFPDVPSGAWYANAVAWAKDKGVTYGDENGRFGATDDLTREQLATMFYRYAKMNGKADESDADLTFKDNAEISDWAEAAIKWCVANGIVSGKGNNILDPQGKATRAEMATIIQRFVEKVS